MDFQAQRLCLFGQAQAGQALGKLGVRTSQVQRRELVAKVPNAAQKAVTAFHTRVVPLQGGLGRRGEHGVQAGGVCAVFLDQVLRVDTIVFRLGHGAHAFVVDRSAHRQIAHGFSQARACNFASGIVHMLHVLRPEIVFAALVGASRVNMVEHHALCEQLGKGLINLDQAQIAHHLGPKARIQKVQDGVLDAADVLVHRRPIGRALGHHRLGVGRVAVAHVVPAGIHKGVHGVGLAPSGLATYRAGDAGMKAFMLVQRIARTVRNAVLRQHHRQVFFRHRHGTVFCAMDDGNRRAPVALAADAPVA